MKVSFFERHPLFKDIFSLVVFVICVAFGTVLLNTFVFRSYNVVGKSMEDTMLDGDRLIVNRLAVSAAHFAGEEYVPERGQIIVFANGAASGPLTCEPPSDVADQYIIKRVIAFPGERVTVKDGVLKVYNEEWPEGYEVDQLWRKDGVGPKEDVAGEVDMTIPSGEIFVAGDNRTTNESGQFNSFDSRIGLGTVPYCRIVGPVLLRIFPFDRFSIF